MRRPLLAIATALAFAAASPCIAHSTDDNVLPGGQPLILGKVSRVTAHSVVVLTRDGESLPIEFDSRTVMVTTMPTGCRVRVEFRLLDSGRYLAQRITPVERGSVAWAALDPRRASRNRYKTETVVPAVYSNAGTDGQDASTTDETASNAPEGTDATVASSDGAPQPSTGSALPKVLVVATLMLAGLLLLKWVARRRAR